MPRVIRSARLLGVSLLGVGLLSGCVANNPTGESVALTVESSADGCTVSATETPAGAASFSITNTGDQVTEFYLLGDDGLRIVGEAENIGPGLTRDLVVQLAEGSYFTACKPGMTGDGIGKAAFTVTPSASGTVVNTDLDAQVDTANENYTSYVKDQISQLVTGTDAFATAYLAGDDETARALYAPTRMHWERVETVAESFGDLDPKLDLREADLEEGQDWTGWHAIEKDLWPNDAEGEFEPYSAEKRAALTEQLVTDTATLDANVQELSFTLSQQTNGAIGLLDEVATGKVTGEEEAWSHTDLWDFQANIDGAKVLYAGVRDILLEEDPDLAASLDTEFAALQTLLDAERIGDGFTLYTDLTPAEIRALADQVNALGEPLNRLTAALVL
ncbi:iron uptake system protein EfeO [Cryobacterium luteum]|uniref:PbrT family lead (Pb2+) uptake porter n=1 Tax=Cryobacterium luteum TaxID=1424661 RepID=A0A1H8DZH1_9MICO|nr:iron uptake system protein EfeO [Cryobacterium luteum]TFB89769.1 PbrT family lead (Pb2+) uptake porter [Cryobacterium luteum]SEN12603.1 iron uptake system component EfeO [Cryobacterium luteum]